MSHGDWEDAAAAYALDALDAAEHEAFERHMETCETCRQQVASLRDTVGMLAYTLPSAAAAPPARLRERVLREARQVGPLGGARQPGARWASLSWLAAAACLLLSVVAGRAWLRVRGDSAQLSRTLAEVRSDLAVRDSLIAAFLGPEVHVVSLSAVPNEAKPSLRVYWNHTRNTFIVTAFNLPPAPAGKTYQLWAVTQNGPPLSMGTFDTDVNGRATTLLAVGDTINSAGFIDSCALTLEPAGGSPQPTEPARFIGAWRHTD
ncbi:MAG: anti-sigma factor [Gemmatimonadaceae bacterium]